MQLGQRRRGAGEPTGASDLEIPQVEPRKRLQGQGCFGMEHCAWTALEYRGERSAEVGTWKSGLEDDPWSPRLPAAVAQCPLPMHRGAPDRRDLEPSEDAFLEPGVSAKPCFPIHGHQRRTDP